MRTCVFILVVFLNYCLAQAEPPFHGTIFIAPNIIQPDDPTAFKSLKYKGQKLRTMYDRRPRPPAEGWVKLKAHLFQAIFDDGQQVEVQVNPEFDKNEALQEAKKYLPVIGQLPATLRADVKTVWIHQGDEGFGGGNNNLLIHTDRGEDYITKGILAETFIHEACHTSLDAYHAKNKKWLEAQKKDGAFISKYAQDNPLREDIAESFLLYFALRFKPERIDAVLISQIKKTMSYRIKYFDSIHYDLHPVEAKSDKITE